MSVEDEQTQLICFGEYCPCSGAEYECECTANEAGTECTDCESPLKRIYTNSGEDVVLS